MGTLVRSDLDCGVVRLSLDSGSGNPLTPATVDALRDAVARLESEPPRALVLDGGTGKLFSGGFDVPTIAPYSRAELHSFFTGFLDVVARILVLPCPTVVAIHSHAIAGGFILSLAFDLRVVRRERVKLGLSEVDLAIAVPAGTQVLLAERTSPQTARRLAMTGHTFGPDEALANGYADELADDPQARGLELAEVLARKPGRGAIETRRFLATDLRDRMVAADRTYLDRFLDTWMSPEGQLALQALARRLTA